MTSSVGTGVPVLASPGGNQTAPPYGVMGAPGAPTYAPGNGGHNNPPGLATIHTPANEARGFCGGTISCNGVIGQIGPSTFAPGENPN